jgi:hypothetical protein
MKNKAEEFVYKVCRNTFLSLWSYANPLGKDGKELCDILVVCEPHIIIFSVKEIKVSDSGDITTDWKRWNRKAVEESSKQIYGAERWLKTSTHVIQKDGTRGLLLPKGEDQIIHRVAVALGGKDKVPIIYGDLGKGFIHVFDEISFGIVLQELDTITDFIRYLSAKENLYLSGTDTPFLAGEENLLALYIHSGKKFPSNINAIFIDGDVWNTIVNKPEYKRKKEQDKMSYAWDRLIDDIGQHVARGTLALKNTADNGELILRTMAREDRFGRRILGKSFVEFIYLSAQNKIRARMLLSPAGVVYVFLAIPHTIERRYRLAELGTRCFVARGLNQQMKTVIGIATEQYKPGIGHSFDLYYLYKPDWTEKDQTAMESIQKESGFFTNMARTEAHEDEYPQE